MSLFDCIGRAVTQGGMDPGRAQTARDLFQELSDRYGQSHDPATAQAMATADVARIMREQTRHKRRVILMQVQAQRRLADAMDNYRNSAGHNDQADALVALLEWDQAAQFENVASVREALRGRYHRMISEGLYRHRTDLLGRTRNKAEVDGIVDALHGDPNATPEAKAVADAVDAAFERARLDFNAAGGNIGRLEDFGVPHSHDGTRIKAAGFDAWRDEIGPRLDWDRIVDRQTGKPFAAGGHGAKAVFLKEIYADITTDGWDSRSPSFSAAIGRKALYNSRADHRVLHFRSGAEWRAYNEAFGRDDPWTAIIGHLDRMARDTAQMRVLGPNPAAGLEFATQYATKAAQTRGWQLERFNRIGFSDPVNKVAARGHTARNMLALTSGAANSPVNSRWAAALAGTRAFLNASYLQSAMLSASTDPVFAKMAANHVGMDAGRVMKRYFRFVAQGGDRVQAVRAGIVSDLLASGGAGMARYLGEVWTPDVAHRLSEFVMRAQGLSGHTDNLRMAFQMEFMGFLADHARTDWGALPRELRELFLQQRGFTEADWNVIRSTPLADIDGAPFLIPDDMRARTDIEPEAGEGLALRLMAAIREQAEFAVPSASLRGRAMLIESRPGTFAGEIQRSTLMFKSFGLSLMFNQLGRVLFAKQVRSRAEVIAIFAAFTTLAGGVAMNLKEIAKGRDPRPMNTPEFWGAAALQGGGFGIMGDFLYASESRFGGGLAATVGGPLVGFTGDALKLTIGNAMQAARGEDTRAGRELVTFLRRHTPPGELWYLNLATQRLLFDNLQRALDPEAERYWRRAERRRVNEYGNESFFGPGDVSPRAPDLGNLFGSAAR
jgi:hypothetical protein